MRIFIGCCGFAGGMKKYFNEFDSVEVQQTFYRLPMLKTLEKWRMLAPKNFVFTVKCFQGITHPISSPTWRRSGIKELEKLENKVGFLKPTKEVLGFWEEVLKICKVLNSPICLIQLPSSFKENEENMENAENFFSKINRDELSIALELRGWSKEGFKYICKKFDLISCVDPFKDRPLHFSSKRIAYFRLHGSPPGKRIYRYKYSKEDLQKLIEIFKDMKKGKVKEVFCFFNNIYMLEDAKNLKSLIRKLKT